MAQAVFVVVAEGLKAGPYPCACPGILACAHVVEVAAIEGRTWSRENSGHEVSYTHELAPDLCAMGCHTHGAPGTELVPGLSRKILQLVPCPCVRGPPWDVIPMGRSHHRALH